MKGQLLLLPSLALLCTVLTLHAQMPRELSYQGVAYNNIGKGYVGTHIVTFGIYSTETGGIPLYSETQNSVPFNSGVFSAIIGSVSTIPSSLDFNQQLYLGISIDNNGEISPRSPFSAVPYALYASTSGRSDTADYVINAQKVGGYSVSPASAPLANSLVALGTDGKFPSSVIPTSSNSLTPPVSISSATAGATFYSVNTGAGNAGSFIVNSSSGNAAVNPALLVETNGRGGALHAQVDSNGFGTAVRGVNEGSGSAGSFVSNSTSNGYSAVKVEYAGVGAGVYTTSTNPASQASALYAESRGASQSIAVVGLQKGLGNAAWFEIDSSTNARAALYTETRGTSYAGRFKVSNASNSGPSLLAETNGTGTAMTANHTGSSGNIAIFQSGSSNKARIDKNGKGYFNGGTQSSGADVAESFDVEGDAVAYEPGDVLVISTVRDRAVARSGEPYSTLVAGVYAIKPGVLLTERDVDADLSDMVPMGVVGVIPTKVTTENGPIRRGDMLVTSSTSGCAMKGTDRDRMQGAVIGKALQDFDSQGIGKINVLVNVK